MLNGREGFVGTIKSSLADFTYTYDDAGYCELDNEAESEGFFAGARVGRGAVTTGTKGV